MTISFDQGTYRARITNWGLSKAGTGTSQVFFSFQCIGMVDPTEPEGQLVACPDYERTIFRAITEKTIEFLAQDLQRLGYDRENFDGLDRNKPSAFDFMGLEIDVRCKHDQYKGQTKERWDFAWGGGSFEAKPIENGELAKLNALFGRKLRASQKDGAKRQFANPVAPELDAGSDIPF